MRTRQIDLFAAWAPGPMATVITTNGEVTGGQAVMGAGVAAQAAKTWPETKRALGSLLSTMGNHCYVLPVMRQYENALATFPTKNDWRKPASLTLIEQSCREITLLADTYGWDNVFLPRPGCGNGRLLWSQVEPVISPLLDDRFMVVFQKGQEVERATPPKVLATKGALSKAATKRIAKKKVPA